MMDKEGGSLLSLTRRGRQCITVSAAAPLRKLEAGATSADTDGNRGIKDDPGL